MDPQTVKAYNDTAQDYVNRVTTSTPSTHLRAFMDALPKGGHALDLGCGPGNSAAMMRDEGFQVTAIDPSTKMVELGKAKYDLDIQLGSFDDVTQNACYDGVWANFSLLHAARADIPRHLSAIHTALKPKGIFTIGVTIGSGSKRDEVGRKYTYFEADEIDRLVREAGFTPIKTVTGFQTTSLGEKSPWIIITAHA